MPDLLSATLLLTLIILAVLGPVAWLLWLHLRRWFRALVAARDRIDNSKRW